MKISKSTWGLAGLGIAALGLVIAAFWPVAEVPVSAPSAPVRATPAPSPAPSRAQPPPVRKAAVERPAPPVREPESVTDEAAEAEAERRVEAFDELTDRWMDALPEGREPTNREIGEFLNTFNQVPADRKEECLQRALNLIPDENVMLLVGVLMDRQQAREHVDLVFRDVLNRDEKVKQPILRQIYRDKSHPCWADVAWILDVTGEK